MHADYAQGMEHHDISIPEVVSRRGEGLTLESWYKKRLLSVWTTISAGYSPVSSIAEAGNT